MKPIRVLHVLGAMNVGGVETWLMHVLRNIDRDRFQMDFLVHTDQPAAYDNEVLALGSRILRCPHTGNPLFYAKQFLRIIKRDGPFDVLHSHVHQFSGIALALGQIAGIPVRVAHSHTDTTAVESRAGLGRRTYANAMRRLIRTCCTDGFAVSEETAAALFGSEWNRDPRMRVFYCGIDLAEFRSNVDPVAVRAEFGFSPNDRVFGSVGRFHPLKNHFFFLDVAAAILKQEPLAKFLLVGDGPLRAQIETRSAAMGLHESITFAGIRSDIPRLMMGAMDVLLVPSLREGLPLVLMETQAAGLPCVASDALTEEAIVNPALVRRLPLSAGPREWARVACATASQPRIDRHQAVDVLAASPFDIKRGIQQMCATYLERALAPPTQSSVARKLDAKKRA